MSEGKTPPEELETTRASEAENGFEQRIGPYRLLQKIGEGGMGEVWLAQQEKPVRRRVALKLIKLGMDTKQVMARFEAERQALAMMDHPNIAKVFDAGADDRGRPFFVMEHVKGVPITEHCDRQRLTTGERLELFKQVCEGVQHAHQNAIIHRDLKPSNVLVSFQDARAVPKIIDFGVAKATNQRLTDKTMFTELGVMIGTPEYMSPEQAEMTGQDVDTRTDVYSLGVLLYELLVGALPFDPKGLREAGFDAIRRKIREDEPSKPSARLTTLGERSTESARRRKTDPATLQRELRGDLDWIVMKALEKDRARRYGSPTELAADIARHLRDEPVLASPPSNTYRARKFIRRHKVGVSVAVGLVFLLLGFSTGMSVLYLRAVKAEVNFAKEAETALQALDFMTGMFEVLDPSEARGNTVTAREILDKGAEEIEDELDGQPLVQATLMDAMGRVYESLGLWEPAGALLERALRIRETRLSERDPAVAESLSNLGWLRQFQGRFDEADSLHKRALALREAALGVGHVDTGWSLYRLGLLHLDQGNLAEARAYTERAQVIFERELGVDDHAVARCLNDLGHMAGQAGDLATARTFFERALKIKEHSLSPDHPDMALALNNLGYTLTLLGDYPEAKNLLERAVVINQKTLGPDHPNLAASLHSLGDLMLRMKDFGGARPLLERALTIQDEALEPDNPYLAVTLHSLGILAHGIREFAASESFFQRALAIRDLVLPPDHLLLAETLEGYAALLQDMNRTGEAKELESRAESIRTAK